MTKTPAEVELMAEAGRRLASVFTHLDGLALAGMTTMEINDRVEAFIGSLSSRCSSSRSSAASDRGSLTKLATTWSVICLEERESPADRRWNQPFFGVSVIGWL